jgi:hypothetical protein
MDKGDIQRGHYGQEGHTEGALWTRGGHTEGALWTGGKNEKVDVASKANS